MPLGRGEDTHNRCPTPYPVSSCSTTWTKGIKDRENVVDQSKYVYHNEIYMWRPSEGGIWPIKAQNSPDERPHRSPKHKDKHKCQEGSITVL